MTNGVSSSAADARESPHLSSCDTWARPKPLAKHDRPAVSCREFHAQLPGYEPTPLHVLTDLATDLGVGTIAVKDESRRLGLPAFKMLGASWGVYRALCQRLPDCEAHRSDLDGLRDLLAAADETVLVTATAGNHGRAVARMARLLGLGCVIMTPSTVSGKSLRGMRSEGADVRVVNMGYDSAVEEVASLAANDSKYLMVQDTAWLGYEDIPRWIVEGYHTLFQEIDEDLAAVGRNSDLIAIPTGVASLLAAGLAHYMAPDRSEVPAVVSVESVQADCVLASMRAGTLVEVDTDKSTTAMSGLNAGTISVSAWPLISAGLSAAIAIDDPAAVQAQALLHDRGVPAGLCGSAALASIICALTGPNSDEFRRTLQLDENSTVVIVSTDGDDPLIADNV